MTVRFFCCSFEYPLPPHPEYGKSDAGRYAMTHPLWGPLETRSRQGYWCSWKCFVIR